MSTHDAYIYFTDIQGEAGDGKHKDWLGVERFNFSVYNAVEKNATSGLSSGIANIGLLNTNVSFDKGTISLRNTLIKGKHIKEIKLIVRRQSGEQEEWYKLELQNALLVSSDLMFDTGHFYTVLAIAFQIHTESYIPLNFEGIKSAELTYSWDSYTNEMK